MNLVHKMIEQSIKVRILGGLGMKLANDTIKMLEGLSKDKRGKVEAVVRRHVEACLKNGFPPENIDRVYLEAVEIVNLEAMFPEPVVEEVRDWEPHRHYDQYVSPKAA
jgi:hypothetical protein